MGIFDGKDIKDTSERQYPLYEHGEDVRSPFERDANRILHSRAYRRLKHKTQVFCNIDNDHVCTRMEHVMHVQSVSDTIAHNLGLDRELTRAIAMGHDLGHAPFGHEGERILDDISLKCLQKPFWHERNGLYFADNIELLPDDEGCLVGLNLTYAVRDGIISHCGEEKLKPIYPREEKIDLEKDFLLRGAFSPYTWEGCVVKLADKIAYVGRDIEDALSLGILTNDQINMLEKKTGSRANTTSIMGKLIRSVCKNSSPERGITLDDEGADLLNGIMAFNSENIYSSDRLKPFGRYCTLLLNELFDFFMESYKGPDTICALLKHPLCDICRPFASYLCVYCDGEIVPKQADERYSKNRKIYENLDTVSLYAQAALDYLAGMTDRYAVKMYECLLRYSSENF